MVKAHFYVRHIFAVKKMERREEII